VPADVDATTASSVAAHLDRQQLAQLRPASVQEHALVAVADAEQRRNVTGCDAFDVAEDHDLPLLLREHRQQRLHALRQLFGDEPIVDSIGPRDRRLGPCAGRIEPFDRVTVWSPGTLLAPDGAAGAVEQDPEEPRLERRASLESIDATHDREPGVLACLLGNRTAADGRFRQAEEARLVAANQLGERGLVAGAQPIDQSGVILHGRRNYVA